LKKAQDEEDERIRIQEEKEEAERVAAEAIREKNRLKKAEKIEKQKAAGTYMTKAEKEKAKKAQARVEAMKEAGMLDVEGESAAAAATTAPKSSAAMFSKKKNKKNQASPRATSTPVVTPEAIVMQEKKKKEEEEEEKREEKKMMADIKDVAVNLPVLDSWDDAGSDDDWESASNNVLANLEALKVRRSGVDGQRYTCSLIDR
jgi:translation initiation factor 5B